MSNPLTVGTLTPFLCLRNAAKAIEYYVAAFGAKTLFALPGPDGRLWHAHLLFGESHLMLSEEFPEFGARGPQSLGGSSAAVHLQVTDVDATFQRAVDLGAKPIMHPADMFWGDRYCKIVDPFGQEWSIATPKESLTPDQIKQRAASAFSQPADHEPK